MEKPELKQAKGQDEPVRELERLEQQAGIFQGMKVARAGRDLPPGALGDQATPQEYVAHDYDHRRSLTRDAYFSVDDVQRRRQLIALSRKIDNNHRQSAEEQLDAARNELTVAKAMRQSWGTVALFGVVLVAFGYWASQGAGAIAGALAAFFLGLGVIANARNDAKLKLTQAMHKLEQAKKTKTDYTLFPEVFSAAEEMSGQRDNDFDSASAYRNTLRRQEGSFQ